MAESGILRGGCMCGRVRYEADGPPLGVAYCHCESCRRHTGAPAVVFVTFREGEMRFPAGERRFYESSPGIHRAFCGDCGTPLSWEAMSRRLGERIIEVYVGTLDDPTAVRPALHWFDAERLPWFETTDHLPRFSRLDGEGIAPVRSAPADDMPG